MKFIVVLVLIILGVMALRKRVYFSMHSGFNGPVQDQRKKAGEEPARKEGEVSIDTNGYDRGKGADPSGDYVDYEEVK